MRSEFNRLWGLPWYFSLREEARKSWEHRISDKIVHLDKVFVSEYEAFTRLVDFKLNFDIWVEVHLFLNGERKAHYCLIVDLLSIERDRVHTVDPAEIKFPAVRNLSEACDMSVLVNIPELVQSPEMSGFEIVPCVVWLHRLHDGDCRFGDTESDLSQSDLCIYRVFIENREREFASWLRGCQQSQLPCEMIQRGSKGRNKISRRQYDSEKVGIESMLNLDDVLPFLDIIIGSNSVTASFRQSSNLFPERIEVFLRPLHLKSRMPYAGLHALS